MNLEEYERQRQKLRKAFYDQLDSLDNLLFSNMTNETKKTCCMECVCYGCSMNGKVHCLKRPCPCHGSNQTPSDTPTEAKTQSEPLGVEWDKKIDEKFTDEWWYATQHYCDKRRQAVKDIVNKALLSQRNQIRESIRKVLDETDWIEQSKGARGRLEKLLNQL